MRYQINLESAEPEKVDYKFSENIPAGIHGYDLALASKLLSINSDVLRLFDLI